jgi:hypothetical protein
MPAGYRHSLRPSLCRRSRRRSRCCHRMRACPLGVTPCCIRLYATAVDAGLDDVIDCVHFRRHATTVCARLYAATVDAGLDVLRLRACPPWCHHSLRSSLCPRNRRRSR